ncbi:MAG: nicotinate phosphoribosyltransferase [Bacteroidetes bacterium]|nr:nicotinate phosphoribosyltransferase [Bacteroidota bacterium]
MSSYLHSILDNDFYKITMQCAVIRCFPNEVVRYQFINRGAHQFPDGFSEQLRKAVAAMAELQLTKKEKKYLQETCPYLDLPYIDFLEGYRYDPDEVNISQKNGALEVSVQGLWYRTILWEVPLLSLISEIYYELTGQQRFQDDEVLKITHQKAEIMESLGVTFAEFGTRRRHSFKVHDLVLEALCQEKNHFFIGSSNVYLAMKYGVKPIGTHAHEWFMFHGAAFGFKMANQLALEHWVDVYRGDLGVALSDTYTTDVFFKQFDKKFAKLFDGVRHDSGDPLLFADKTTKHYQQNGINPLFKYIIFSDGLNIEKVKEITQYCKGKIGISFGIGTHLTNDVGLEPMNIVMKMTAIQSHDEDWIPTVKLSDEKGKYTGDPTMIQLAKAFLNIHD